MRGTPWNIGPQGGSPLPARPRERVLAEGATGLSDEELLALVLRTGAKGQDAVALAAALLHRFGGLAGLLQQDAAALRQTHGLGAAKAASLLAARELATRMAFMRVKRGRYLENTKSVLQFLMGRLAGLQREVFGLLLLNARHNVLGVDYLFYGSVDRSAVYPREIVKACLKRNAAAVVLFHNHPSGDAEPSEADKDITKRVSAVLDEIDVHVIDHVIVAGTGPVSMAERGLVPTPESITTGCRI